MCIRDRENMYNDGQEFTGESLMLKAEAKYTELMSRNLIKSGADKSNDMVALQERFDELSETVKNFKPPGSAGGGAAYPGTRNTGNADKKPRKQDSWMFQAPGAGEPTTKTVNTKVYYFCPGNGTHKPKWVRHETSMCKGLEGASGDPPVAMPPAASNAAPVNQNVGWSTAMQATISDVG